MAAQYRQIQIGCPADSRRFNRRCADVGVVEGGSPLGERDAAVDGGCIQDVGGSEISSLKIVLRLNSTLPGGVAEACGPDPKARRRIRVGDDSGSVTIRIGEGRVDQ